MSLPFLPRDATIPDAMISKPFISIIMNCFNSGLYLREALASVLAQKFQDWEVIFWDNQSTDESASIFKSYTDPRLKYHFAPTHTTLSEARNKAVEKASGEWVAFLDCDDLWHPEKLASQVSLINKEGPELGIVYGRTLLLLPSGQVTAFKDHDAGQALPSGQIFTDLLMLGNFIPLVSAAVRKSAYWEVGGIPAQYTYAEDYYLFVAVSEKYRAAVVDEPCCTYRTHSANMSASMKSEMWLEAIWVLDKFGRGLAPKVLEERKSEFFTYQAKQMVKEGRILEGARLFAEKGSTRFLLSAALAKLRKLGWR